jgi:hypothetical protein
MMHHAAQHRATAAHPLPSSPGEEIYGGIVDFDDLLGSANLPPSYSSTAAAASSSTTTLCTRYEYEFAHFVHLSLKLEAGQGCNL